MAEEQSLEPAPAEQPPSAEVDVPMADVSTPAGDTLEGPVSVAPGTVAEAAPPVKAPPPLPELHFWTPAASAP
eukprot:6209283-Lingulodinium_polyedra.AAC.1